MTRKSIFVTGATGLLGGGSLSRILAERPDLHAYVLVRDPGRWVQQARLLKIRSDRVTPVRGDLREPALGLDASTRRTLADRAGAVLHLAADIVFSRTIDVARETNVHGTRNLLDLTTHWGARFCYVSTAFVAGCRTGRITESDPGGQAGWVNAYEQSKWEAEQLVRCSGQDFLILRSSTVVCDDAAGGITQFNAVHHALRLLHGGLAPMIPGRAEATVDLLPADYVAGAVAALALRPELTGETLHLCAGERSATLGELLELSWAVWARDPTWRRRNIARPALADLATYRLFEAVVEETADQRLRHIARSLKYFAPQLALEKRFDTTRADAALGHRPPWVWEYWVGLVTNLVRDQYPGRASIAAVAA
jgi:long-chain acyl-CoA synthetase